MANSEGGSLGVISGQKEQEEGGLTQAWGKEEKQVPGRCHWPESRQGGSREGKHRE